MYKGNKEITLKSSIIIAIAQGLAIFPGFSRSGLTISTGWFLGLDRVKAARFSKAAAEKITALGGKTEVI